MEQGTESIEALHAAHTRRHGSDELRQQVELLKDAAEVGDIAARWVPLEAWASARGPKRKAMLTDLHKALDHHYYGRGGPEHAPRPKWVRGKDDEDAGGYSNPDRQIEVNKKLLSLDHPLEAVATLIHERFHDYQLMVAGDPLTAPRSNPRYLSIGKLNKEEKSREKNTEEKWRENQAYYKEAKFGYENYRAQPLERDAFGFEALAALRYALRLDGAEDDWGHYLDPRDGFWQCHPENRARRRLLRARHPAWNELPTALEPDE